MLPYLIDFGFFKLPAYGAAMAIAYICAYFWIMRNGVSKNFDRVFLENSVFYSILSGLAGAKILYLATFWSSFGIDFSSRLKGLFSLDNLKAGFVFYGGFIGAVSFLLFYCRRKNISFLRLADLFAPALALGHAIGRLGCFSAGCCHGGPTSMPWGVTFTNPYCQTDPHYMNMPLHPTQLYESMGDFLIFLLLSRIYRKGGYKNEGKVFFLYAFLYSAIRFINEFFRADSRGAFFLGLSQAQIISLTVSILSAVYLFLRGRKNA